MKSGLDGASPLRRPLLVDDRPYRRGLLLRLPPHRVLVACAAVLGCAGVLGGKYLRQRLLLNAVVLEGTQSAPKAWSRCEWVVAQVEAHNANKSQALRRKQYSVQSQDPNMFYRGTAYLFWHDFARGGWGEFNLSTLGPDATRTQTPRTAAWTWITGDQHLSNFGAWRNRNNDVVYGVNDFDEAAIYDFHIDIYRLAVSIYDHALSTSALALCRPTVRGRASAIVLCSITSLASASRVPGAAVAPSRQSSARRVRATKRERAASSRERRCSRWKADDARLEM